jgi:Sec-independent protein translocase protein TatA
MSQVIPIVSLTLALLLQFAALLLWGSRLTSAVASLREVVGEFRDTMKELREAIHDHGVRIAVLEDRDER